MISEPINQQIRQNAAEPRSSEPTERPFDPARAEEFSAKILGLVNSGALSLMASIGHQTGLFDTLATLGPSSAVAIARAASLNERYVREWLGAMVMGGILEYDPDQRTYFLPREHAACLTRAAGLDNLAAVTQFVPLFANVEQAMLEVFRNGGGLPYSAFPRFHELMAEDSRAVLEATLLSRTLPSITGMSEKLEAGIDVADIGCGRGVAIELMARRFPQSRFLGIDNSSEAIEWARAAALREGLPHARFELRDAATFGGPAAFDFITAFDAIHDQAHPRRVLHGIREALRPGGVFLMVDIALSSHLEKNLEHPLAPLLYTASTLHCTAVSLGCGGEGLGACWGEEQARELLAEAGFSRVTMTRIEGDPMNGYYVCQP